MNLDFTPASDALGQTAPLTETLELPVLGVPLIYRSNSRTVIDVAEHAFHLWRHLPQALVEPGSQLKVDIIVHAAPGGAREPCPTDRLCFRAHGDSFLAAGGGGMLSAQPASGAALAFVSPELAADEPNLRHNVIEMLGLLLINYRDRTPVRAAGVVRNGLAVLLAGERNAGKSTLCYACMRAGFALLAEDVVCVSLARRLRVWGHPGLIHLPPDAPRFFPELAALEPHVRANGKLKLAVDVSALGRDRLATHADRAVVCFVERGRGQASSLDPLPTSDAITRLSHQPAADFARLRERVPAVAAALAAGGAYRLTVGADPAGAAALLAYLAEQGRF